jgi:hypothetical protein
MAQRALLGLMVVCVGLTQAQELISARAGVVAYVEGEARVDGNAVRVPQQLQDGQTLSTSAARAEVLLMPGVFLRMDEGAVFRMDDTRLASAQLTMQEGSAFLEVQEIAPGARLRVRFGEAVAEFKNPGVYLLDAGLDTLRVYNGQVIVWRAGAKTGVKRGKIAQLRTGLSSGFNAKELASLASWAARRTWQSWSSERTQHSIAELHAAFQSIEAQQEHEEEQIRQELAKDPPAPPDPIPGDDQ